MVSILTPHSFHLITVHVIGLNPWINAWQQSFPYYFRKCRKTRLHHSEERRHKVTIIPIPTWCHILNLHPQIDLFWRKVIGWRWFCLVPIHVQYMKTAKLTVNVVSESKTSPLLYAMVKELKDHFTNFQRLFSRSSLMYYSVSVS